MAGAAEVEIDKETGHIELLQFAAAVDCGTPLNENLARVQTEGGLAQGIGMAMYEDVTYSDHGRVHENSFMQYKVPSRLDIGKVQVEFECSYEQPAHLAQNPSVRSLSTPHLRLLQMQCIMQ